MADDFDDLLNEVETNYCPPKEEPQRRVSPVKSRDIDKDIEELLFEDELVRDDTREQHQMLPSQLKTSLSTSKKCHPILIGGCGIELKYNDNKNKGCDQLRCLSCDSKIIWFDNYSWAEGVDYLFFRNNYPNKEMLKTKLQHNEGYRCYCCQCSWTQAHHLVRLSDIKSLKWTCGKHNE